jgi:hypothetical protein
VPGVITGERRGDFLGSQSRANTRDRGGKRNPACKAVLVDLANHAAPDGKDAFPSVRTLVRYIDLSERTVCAQRKRLMSGSVER